MKISVCIPCHVNNVECVEDILNDLSGQTVKPDEVIVFVKPVPPDFELPGEQVALMSSNDINLVLLTSENQSTMGEAKNRCSEKASGDILCFMDCDDRVHPQKIECVHRFFDSEGNDSVFLHSYTRNDIDHFHDDLLAKQGYELVFSSGGITKVESGAPIHFAHSSMPRKIVERFPFDESGASFRKDDLLQIEAIISGGLEAWFLNKHLVSYTV